MNWLLTALIIVAVVVMLVTVVGSSTYGANGLDE